jgi:ATP adenylyltransferase/5',5'''-P-1,P-4-tetraphosphate phosphorylase II
MQENLKDILSNLSNEIDQDTLLLYLQDKLSAEKKHEVEKILAENEFAADALDGLQEFSDKRQVSHMVEMLNRDLKKKTERKKQRRDKLKLPDQSWIIISVVIIILLIIISYIVVAKAS